MQHPPRKDRHWFIVPCAVASLGFLVAAGANAWLRRTDVTSGGFLDAIALVLEVLLLLCGAAFFARCSFAVARGPDPAGPREVKSQEPAALLGLAVMALFFDMVALRCGLVLRDGTYDSKAGTIVGMIFCVVLGLPLTLFLVSALPATLRRGRSRLLLPEGPCLAGTTLRAELELPLPHDEAPPLVATVRLRRTKAGIGEGAIDEESVVWSQKVRVDGWQPRGSRRCRAPFAVDLPEEVPADFGAHRISYSWVLETLSVDPKLPFGGSYLLPIAFRDPVAEGVVAPP